MHQDRVNHDWYTPYETARKQFNRKLKTINAKYDYTGEQGHYVNANGKFIKKEDTNNYYKDLDNAWRESYTKALLDYIGEEPLTTSEKQVMTGREWVNSAPSIDLYSRLIQKT